MNDRRLLIVDDDSDIREVLMSILEAQGYEVAGAADGLEALERLAKGPPPSLIILDLMMPRMNGVQLLERMRAMPRFADIPVLVLSGDAHGRELTAKLGVRACLLKPIELTELEGALDQALQE